MKVLCSQADIDAIKAELAALLPKIKSSHRVEALARGLGWNTNAALRADLTAGRMERMVDDVAFNDYLEQHDISVTRRGAFLRPSFFSQDCC